MDESSRESETSRTTSPRVYKSSSDDVYHQEGQPGPQCPHPGPSTVQPESETILGATLQRGTCTDGGQCGPEPNQVFE